MDVLKQKNQKHVLYNILQELLLGICHGMGRGGGGWGSGGVFISRRSRSSCLSCEWPAAVGTLAISSSSAISITKSGDPVGGGGIVSQSDREPSLWGGRAPFCLKRARRGDEEERAWEFSLFPPCRPGVRKNRGQAWY